VFARARFSELNWYTADGRPDGSLNLPRGRYTSPAISRDGRYLAVQRYQDAQSRIEVVDLRSGNAAAVVSRGMAERPSFLTQFAVWGPGARLAYASSDHDWLDIFAAAIDTGERPVLLLRTPVDKMPTDWSPDGRFLAFAEISRNGSYTQQALPLDGGVPQPLGDHVVSGATYSPDSSQVAYVSGQSGRLEVWVRPVSGNGGAIRVSTDGGVDPAWLSNQSVSFLDRAGRLLRVQLPDDREPVAPPTVMMTTRVSSPGAARNNYAWTPDRGRILVIEPARDNDGRLHVMANWSAVANR
jgi:Tol biopolymer transport system component